MLTYDSSDIDLQLCPVSTGILTKVTEMGQFEASYQSFHSLMNFFGLNQLLCGEKGLAMPIIDTDERRQVRARLCLALHPASLPDPCKDPQIVSMKSEIMATLGMD